MIEDAIVIGEYERAFYDSQYASMAPLFDHYGVALWTPEAGGPVGTGRSSRFQRRFSAASALFLIVGTRTATGRSLKWRGSMDVHGGSPE